MAVKSAKGKIVIPQGALFAGFSMPYSGESLRWNHAAGFLCLVGAAFFMCSV